MSTTRGDHGDSTSCDGVPEAIALRSAILCLANDNCPAAHQIADQIIDQLFTFRWRMEAHREREARSVEHLGEWLASQATEPMAKHRHRPIESKTIHGNYMGPLSGRYTNPAARGGKTRTDFCRCGAKRYTNTNTGKQEIGRWHEQLNLNLNPESEKKRPPQTDATISGPCTSSYFPSPESLPPGQPISPESEEQGRRAHHGFPLLDPECDPDSPEARRSRFRVV